MSFKKNIELAIQVIGENTNDDYKIDPTAHVGEFEQTAPEICEILKKSKVQAVAEEYKKWDQLAIAAQNKFKSLSRWTSWTIIGSAICAAGVLVISILAEGAAVSGGDNPVLTGSSRALTAIFALGGIFFGASASSLLNLIRSGRLLEKWMQNRAEAEMRRLKYFKLVTSPQSELPANTSAPVPLLQLEYFRRFQLDVQKTFYTTRGGQHDSSAQKALLFSSLAMGVAALANGASGYLGSTMSIKLTAVAAISIVAKAFVTKISNTEALNQDSRNAERYQRTASVLRHLRGRLDDVRTQVAQGNLDTLANFVEAVHEQLSLEHRQWLENQAQAGTAIGHFEKQLNELKKHQE
ncbi:MAG: hypothetical protein ACE5HS_11255 [bacterium]